jgi:hypothetical protein
MRAGAVPASHGNGTCVQNITQQGVYVVVCLEA